MDAEVAKVQTCSLHAESPASLDKILALGSCSPGHKDMVRSLRLKVSVLSRELATLTQERDLLMELVLGNSAVSGLSPHEVVQRIITDRKEQLVEKQELPDPSRPLRSVSAGTTFSDVCSVA
jgi:hypothetical protein